MATTPLKASQIVSDGSGDGSSVKHGSFDYVEELLSSDFLSVTPVEEGADVFTMSLASALFNGTRLDQVVGFGWNYTGNGGQRDDTQASVAISFESFYQQDATHIWSEFHLIYIDTDGDYVRPLSFQMGQTIGGSVVGGVINGYVSADSFIFADSNPAGVTPYFSFASTHSANSGKFDVQNGGQYRNLLNNSKWMLQVNVGVSEYYSLVYLDGSDYVQVGVGGTAGGHAAGVNVAASGKKLGFFGVGPVIKHATTADVTGFAAGSGTTAKSDSVWAGASGATAYTVGDLVTAMKAYGLLTA